MIPPPTEDHSALPNGTPSLYRSIPAMKLQKFRGKNVSQFLNLYEMYWGSHGCGSAMMALRLPLHVKKSLFSVVSSMPGCKDSNWDVLKRSMRASFCDEEVFKYSLTDLTRFIKERKRRGRPETMAKIRKVYLKFIDISTYLKKMGVLSPQEESRRFLQLLPSHVVDSIFARSDARSLFSEIEGSMSKDEEPFLPGIQELLREVRAVFANLARRGKSSSNWRRRQRNSSDAESESEVEESDSDFLGDEENEETHRSWYASSCSNAKATRIPSREKSPCGSNCQRRCCQDEEKSDAEDTDLGIGNLFSRFEELQLSVNQLVAQQAVTYHPAPSAPTPEDSQHPAHQKSFSRKHRSRNPEGQNPEVRTPKPPIISYTYESHSMMLDLTSPSSRSKPSAISNLSIKTSASNPWRSDKIRGTHIE
ncbi:hypothetical protein P7C70_g9314, partial [Phenoliferia sp. Uapishka_3]